MKAETRKIIVWSLANKVNEYVREKNLFSGGCCWCAYVLADIFTKLGIKYRTVLFQEFENADEHDFSNAIGDYSGITRYYKFFSIKHAIRRYRDITPKMLFDAYAWNDWNDVYCTDNNRPLKMDLYEVVNKFVPIAA